MLAIRDRDHVDAAGDEDLNLDHGFVIIAMQYPARTLFCYQYYNHDLRYHNDCTMWLSEGLVSYQSTGAVTPWHGDYNHGLGDIIGLDALVIRFDYAGRRRRLKTTVLLRAGAGVWQGRDYRHRRVTLTLLDVYEREDGSPLRRRV